LLFRALLGYILSPQHKQALKSANIAGKCDFFVGSYRALTGALSDYAYLNGMFVASDEQVKNEQ
jgi:hypothetical protein